MKARNKEIIFLTTLFVVSLIFWLSLSVFIPRLSWDLTPIFWSVLISVFILLIVWSLIVLLVESTALFIAVWAICAFVGVVWFLNPLFVGVAALLFVFGVVGYFRARSQLQYTLEAGVVKPLRRTVPLLTTFLAASIAVAAYIGSPISTVDAYAVLPEKYFSPILKFLEPAIQTVDPSYRSDITYKQYIISKLGENADGLSEDQIDTFLNQQVSALKEQRGISIDPNQKLSDIIYTVGTRFIERQVELYHGIIPITFAIILFFTLRFLAWPLHWLSIGCAVLILKILYRLGIVELRAIPTTLLQYSLP